MKKLILSTIVLICFSLSAILFELSCHKESIAIPSISQLNKIVYTKPDGIYISNYDGTNETKVNISIPGANPRLTPDGTRVFFHSFPPGTFGIYSAKLDGSDLKLIVTGANELGGVY